MPLDANARKFFASRGIGEKTLARWPVASASVPFATGRFEAVVFNYLRDGERVNWKARAIGEKLFTQQKGGEQRFWNLDRVLAGPLDAVFVVEGEMDALALSEAGVPDDAILAFPGGAPSGDGEQPKDSRRYEHVLKALELGLAKAKRFVLAADNDDPGRRLRRDLATIFGAGKCWTVDWPDGIKDANEALVAWGAEDLRVYVYEAQREWPVAGLFRLDEIPTPPKLETWDTGFPSWGKSVRLAPGMLSVMTGKPGSGKSIFAQQLWFNIARGHDLRVALFSAERPVRPHVQRSLRQYFWGKAEWSMTQAELDEADAWIAERFVFLVHPNYRPSFGWLLDTIEAAAQRYGCRVALVDPWNKLEAEFDHRAKTETQWIGECLDRLLDAARSLDMHIQVVAHPAKPMAEQRKEPPDLYAIAGSAHWYNRVDQGFAIHRPQVVDHFGNRLTEAKFYHHKARFEELGWQCAHPIRLNLATGCFEAGEADPQTDAA
jgi:twinkle protein